jgi:hypothetical protein
MVLINLEAKLEKTKQKAAQLPAINDRSIRHDFLTA